jgi:hypothetical protein
MMRYGGCLELGRDGAALLLLLLRVQLGKELSLGNPSHDICGLICAAMHHHVTCTNTSRGWRGERCPQHLPACSPIRSPDVSPWDRSGLLGPWYDVVPIGPQSADENDLRRTWERIEKERARWRRIETRLAENAGNRDE